MLFSPGPMRLLEICCDSLISVKNALTGKADRIELCGKLDTGGLSPDKALLSKSIALCAVPIFVLIRPRPGNFIYSEQEKRQIFQSIKEARTAGAAGIVLGAISTDKKIDFEFLAKAKDYAHDLPLTFHRAIDLVPKNEETLSLLVQHGISRILTSGSLSNDDAGWQSPADPQGLEVLLRIKNRPKILACGGIRPVNIKALASIDKLHEIHSAARKKAEVEIEIVKKIKASWV